MASVVGRAELRERDAEHRFAADDADLAERHPAEAADVLRSARDDGLAAARTKWVTDKFSGEQADAAHALVYGVDAPIEVLTLERPWPGEGGAGWPPDEPDRFGLLARRLWARLLDVETLGQA